METDFPLREARKQQEADFPRHEGREHRKQILRSAGERTAEADFPQREEEIILTEDDSRGG